MIRHCHVSSPTPPAIFAIPGGVLAPAVSWRFSNRPFLASFTPPLAAHKQVFFASTWASYETAVPGSFRLVPGEARLQVLAQDYRDMREMFFGEPLSWEDIVARLRALEKSINERAPS